MNGLDAESLEGVRALAQRRLDAMDRHGRLAPLREAMEQRMEAMMTDVTPGIMAAPTAQVRRSVLNMEKSQAAWPEKMRAADAERGRDLARARRRTAALRAWLEALS